MKTADRIEMAWRVLYGKLWSDLVIPAGTRVAPCNDGSGQFWVDDLSWIDSKTQGIARHDAEHYGIRLEAHQVFPDWAQAA